MGKRHQHVIFDPKVNKWRVRVEGGGKVRLDFDKKLAAVRTARVEAKKQGVDLVIHRRDGRIQEIDSYQHRPTRSRLLPR